jgi:hypothetical protein
MIMFVIVVVGVMLVYLKQLEEMFDAVKDVDKLVSAGAHMSHIFSRRG